MDITPILTLGVIQGVTEFLPISSSGHLFLVQHFWGMVPSISLEIWFHVASLGAVVLFFWKDVVHILKKMIPFRKTEESLFGWKLLWATLWTVPVALVTKQILTDISGISFVAGTLFITGLIILFSEWKSSTAQREIVTMKEMLFLGIIQGITVFPGISRSGMTIAFLISQGIEKKKAAQISFLLAIPTILGALIFQLSDSAFVFSSELVWGLVVCFCISLLVIWSMMQWIQKYWVWGAWYCFLLSGVLFVSQYFDVF